MRELDNKLPRIEVTYNSLGACHRQKESVIRRQVQVMKKMEHDKLAAVNEIEALKLKIRDSERHAHGYKQQIEEMGILVRRLKEKHDNEIKVARAECEQSLKQVARLTRKENEQDELIRKLRAENEALRGQVHSNFDDFTKKKRSNMDSGRKPARSNSKMSNIKETPVW